MRKGPGRIPSYSSGDALITLKGINITGNYTYTTTTSYLRISLFQDLPYVSIEDINIDITMNTSIYTRIIPTIFDDIGDTDSYRFNNTSTGIGVESLKNITVNWTSDRFYHNNTINDVSLKENAEMSNLNINYKAGTSTNSATHLFRNLKLSRGNTIKNININLESSSGIVKPNIFAYYIEYDARTEAVGDILIEDIKGFRGNYFIGWLRAIDNHTPSTPTSMQKIKFSKIDTKGPLVHIFDLQSAGSFTDLSVPAMEISNVKIQSSVKEICTIYGCVTYENYYSPIIGGITNYGVTDYRYNSNIYPLTSNTYWTAPSFQPYIKINNLLVLAQEDEIAPTNIITQEADSGAAVVNSTYEGICNTTSSSGNFYSNQITSITDNPAHTSCTALTSKPDSELQDSTSGNIYETAGWDFTNIWKWPEGGGYPELR